MPIATLRRRGGVLPVRANSALLPQPHEKFMAWSVCTILAAHRWFFLAGSAGPERTCSGSPLNSQPLLNRAPVAKQSCDRSQLDLKTLHSAKEPNMQQAISEPIPPNGDHKVDDLAMSHRI